MLPLFYLGRLFLCVMVFFALIGIELFREGLHYGCFVNYTNSAGMCYLYQVYCVFKIARNIGGNLIGWKFNIGGFNQAVYF